MKLAFSTNAFTQYSLSQALQAIKAAGYEGVEILADVPHAWPDDLTAPKIAQIAQELDRLDLHVSNINANCSFGYWKDAPPEPYFEPSLISPNARHRTDRVRLICKTLNFAKAIGASNISITTGRMLGGMPPAKAADQLAESLKPILDYADRAGVNIGIECEPGLYLEYITELKEWIDRLDHPRFGANLDIGHSQVIGESIPDVIRTLNDRIWNLHIEDILGRKHYHLIPGEGTLDWKTLNSALREIGYQRYLTVELYTHWANPHEAAEKSHRFLRDLFDVRSSFPRSQSIR
jgi:sugar phosphate isomerase/epimerase